MRRMYLLSLAAAVAVGLTGARATPTTHVWNPNTDVQPPGTWHLGIDNYFSIGGGRATATALGTSVGLTYGAGWGLEIGADYVGPGRAAAATDAHPVLFNAKWALPEGRAMPALALGIQQLGAHKATQSNIIYALAARSHRRLGRVTLGGYAGRRQLLGCSGRGAIVAWDRALDKRWWVSADWASGDNAYGALGIGAACKVAPNTGILLGYVVFNERSLNPRDVLTTQVDLDF